MEPDSQGHIYWDLRHNSMFSTDGGPVGRSTKIRNCRLFSSDTNAFEDRARYGIFQILRFADCMLVRLKARYCICGLCYDDNPFNYIIELGLLARIESRAYQAKACCLDGGLIANVLLYVSTCNFGTQPYVQSICSGFFSLRRFRTMSCAETTSHEHQTK